MRLAPESQKRIEEFLREHLRNGALNLPPVLIHSGRIAAWVTRTFRIVAITFGRRIFVAPRMIARDGTGRLTAPAGLILHEATHVFQYHQAGFIRFLLSYLGAYVGALREQGQGWGKAARNAAYLAIRQEREAYEAEYAYAGWLALKRIDEERTSFPQGAPDKGGKAAGPASGQR